MDLPYIAFVYCHSFEGKNNEKKKVWKFMAYLKACRFNKYIKTRASNCKAIKIPKFISWYYSSDHHHLEEGVHFPQEEEALLQEGGAEAEVARGTYNSSNKEIP